MGLRSALAVPAAALSAVWLLISVCAVLYIVVAPVERGARENLADLKLEYATKRAALAKEISELEAGLKQDGASMSRDQRSTQFQLQQAKSSLRSVEGRIRSAHDDYIRRNEEHSRLKEGMESEIRKLKNTLATGDPETSTSTELSACLTHIAEASYAYNKLEDQLADLKTLRPFSFNSVVTTPDLLAVYVSSSTEKTMTSRLMVEQLVSSLLATQRDSTSPLTIRVETDEEHKNPWKRPVEECGRGGGGSRDRSFVTMSPNTVVFDGWLRDILKCISSTNQRGHPIAVCCMMVITPTGEHECDEGFFAARCDSAVLEGISSIPADRASARSAFNSVMGRLGDRVRYLPLSEYRRQHIGDGGGDVTTFDVRTLLKVYRASGDGSKVLDRLLRMRARALEEKFNEVESDTRNRAMVRATMGGACEITLSATHAAKRESSAPSDNGQSQWTALRSPGDSAASATADRCHEVIGLIPSYGKDVEDELTLWLNQRYYSDPLPYDHPVKIRSEWIPAIPSLPQSSKALRDAPVMGIAGDQQLLAQRHSSLLEHPSLKSLLLPGSAIDPFLGFVKAAVMRTPSESEAINEMRQRIRDDLVASGRLPFGKDEDLAKRDLESVDRAVELEKMYREQQKEQSDQEQRKIEFS
ncbi:hypothetical protein FOZ61_003839 [Perkinsus olseni]|uniref:Uncharacterized protein n=1 Tax=Perkinsus olseni TaxID=32597 RepID=A0A7J6LN32_PEROL|nr:hypothetical protein FOZ61_003839 [Perkinsus olseni]